MSRWSWYSERHSPRSQNLCRCDPSKKGETTRGDKRRMGGRLITAKARQSPKPPGLRNGMLSLLATDRIPKHGKEDTRNKVTVVASKIWVGLHMNVAERLQTMWGPTSQLIRNITAWPVKQGGHWQLDVEQRSHSAATEMIVNKKVPESLKRIEQMDKNQKNEKQRFPNSALDIRCNHRYSCSHSRPCCGIQINNSIQDSLDAHFLDKLALLLLFLFLLLSPIRWQVK